MRFSFAILLPILIFLLGCSFVTQDQQITQKKDVSYPEKETTELFYDWEIEVIKDVKCDATANPQCKQDELKAIKDVFSKRFPAKEVIFDRYGEENDRFFINATLEAKEYLEKMNFFEDMVNLSFQYHLIIDDSNQKKPTSQEELLLCQFKRDCLKVYDSCCGCSPNVKAKAINRIYYNWWINKLNCEEILCTLEDMVHWTCFAEPDCINNLCILEEMEKT